MIFLKRIGVKDTDVRKVEVSPVDNIEWDNRYVCFNFDSASGGGCLQFTFYLDPLGHMSGLEYVSTIGNPLYHVGKGDGNNIVVRSDFTAPLLTTLTFDDASKDNLAPNEMHIATFFEKIIIGF